MHYIDLLAKYIQQFQVIYHLQHGNLKERKQRVNKNDHH